MRKIITTIVLLFVAFNSNAAISQSGITNLKQLDKNGIIDLVNGNQLIGFISDGPFEGPITQTYFKDGTYETVYENKTYKGKWSAEGESYSSVDDKKMCTKNNNASQWSCFHWYTGVKDGGTYAYVVAQGKIFHQYHEVISADQAKQKQKQKKKKVEKVEKNKEKQVKKKTSKEYVMSFLQEMRSKGVGLSINDTKIYQKIRDDHDLYKSRMYKTVYTNVPVYFTFPSNTKKDNSNYCWIEIDYGDGSKKVTERKRRWSNPYASHTYKKSGLFNLTIRGDGPCKVNNNSLQVYVMDLNEAISLARQDKAEEKRIADEKEAEAKRIADIKKVQKKIDFFLKELKDQDLDQDSLKTEVDNLISEVESNTNSDLKILRGFESTFSNLLSRVKIFSLKDYPGFRDLKPGLPYEGVLEICPLEKVNSWGQQDDESDRSDWVRCYGINNIKFKAYYSDDDLLEWLSLDMGPIVETGGYLSIFGENDSNIFIKMKNTFDKKYSLDYGYSERDRQLFNESQKDRLNRVYANGKVDLRIIRKETDYSYELWLYVNYLDPYQAEIFLNKNRPVRATDDDF